MPGRLQPEEPKATEDATGRAFSAGAPARPQAGPSDLIRPTQRRYSTEEKKRLLRLADACKQPGELAAMLRREGVYHSTIKDFRKQLETGLLDPARQAAQREASASQAAARQRIQDLERENRRLARELQRANLIIDVQKKISTLLGCDLETDEQAEP